MPCVSGSGTTAYEHMKSTKKAYAKINLGLDVVRRLENGYHEVKMVMQTVGIYDVLDFERTDGGIVITTDSGELPTDENNLIYKAAKLMMETYPISGGVKIHLEKHIPIAAGMAGGSTDAAAVLRALNEMTGVNLPVEQLAEIGQRVGSDVPYCVLGGTALAEGRGERLTPLTPLPECCAVLCKPPFPVSTPELFGRIDSVKLRCRPDTAGMLEALARRDLEGVGRRLYNVFEDVLPVRRGAEIASIRNALIQFGALGACMSGTGPTVFGLVTELDQAQAAQADLKRQYRDVFFCKPV